MSDRGDRRGTRSISRSPPPDYRRDRSRRRKSRSYNSRSRSPSFSPKRRSRSNSYGRRRSPSPRYSPRRRDYGRRRPSGRSYRSRSRSPMSARRRHIGNREDPEPGNCVGVFGLSLNTEEPEIRDVFERYGPIENLNVVYDHQTGRSRGFAFVYYRSSEDAKEAKDRCNGIEIDGRRIRVDYSITDRAHTPTPGVYLGKPTRRPRSPSPYRRGGRRYSRSRSRSPRRY